MAHAQTQFCELLMSQALSPAPNRAIVEQALEKLGSPHFTDHQHSPLWMLAHGGNKWVRNGGAIIDWCEHVEPLAVLLIENGANPLGLDKPFSHKLLDANPAMAMILLREIGRLENTRPLRGDDGSNPFHIMVGSSPHQLDAVLQHFREGRMSGTKMGAAPAQCQRVLGTTPLPRHWIDERRKVDGQVPLGTMWHLIRDMLRGGRHSDEQVADKMEQSWNATRALCLAGADPMIADYEGWLPAKLIQYAADRGGVRDDQKETYAWSEAYLLRVELDANTPKVTAKNSNAARL